GRLLLLKGLTDLGYDENILLKINTSRYNKPFLNDEIDFNISHSGQHTVCAIGKNLRLGIDIERNEDEIDADILNVVFTNEEIQYLHSSIDVKDAFYSLWTRKESIIKADGRGFSINLNSINCLQDEVKFEGSTWFLRDLFINKALCATLA